VADGGCGTGCGCRPKAAGTAPAGTAHPTKAS
jgi:hypothetical protein